MSVHIDNRESQPIPDLWEWPLLSLLLRLKHRGASTPCRRQAEMYWQQSSHLGNVSPSLPLGQYAACLSWLCCWTVLRFVVLWVSTSWEKTHGIERNPNHSRLIIYHILVNPTQASLYRRLEVYSSCRHIKKFLLSKAQRWEIKNGSLVIKSDMRWSSC